MAQILPTADGISTLRQLSASVVEGKETLQQLTNTMAVLPDQYRAIGPHRSTINSILDEIKGAVNSSLEPVNELSEKLNSLATSYQEFLDTDIGPGN